MPSTHTLSFLYYLLDTSYRCSLPCLFRIRSLCLDHPYSKRMEVLWHLAVHGIFYQLAFTQSIILSRDKTSPPTSSLQLSHIYSLQSRSKEIPEGEARGTTKRYNSPEGTKLLIPRECWVFYWRFLSLSLSFLTSFSSLLSTIFVIPKAFEDTTAWIGFRRLRTWLSFGKPTKAFAHMLCSKSTRPIQLSALDRILYPTVTSRQSRWADDSNGNLPYQRAYVL